MNFSARPKYNDPTLDYELEVIAVFNNDALLRKLKEFDFPSFFIMNEQLYRSPDFELGLFRNIQKQIKTDHQISVGMDIVQTIKIELLNETIGIFGLVYPARSFGSNFLIFLKVLLALIIITSFILFDIGVERKMKKRTALQQARKLEKVNAQKSEDNLDEDSHLDWIKNFVEKNEANK